MARAAIGGLLVGFGAAIGNGCTSGHGICGNARFSLRSVAYTMTFMAAGAAAASLTGTADALGIARQSAKLVLPSAEVLKQGVVMIATAAATLAGVNLLAWGQDHLARPLELAGEYLSGMWFGLGLVVSGMVQPAKVAGFLSV